MLAWSSWGLPGWATSGAATARIQPARYRASARSPCRLGGAARSHAGMRPRADPARRAGRTCSFRMAGGVSGTVMPSASAGRARLAPGGRRRWPVGARVTEPAGLPDQVQRPAPGLVVDPCDVLADHAGHDQLDTAQERY